MSRKNFIEAQGATCSNWNWSWSFVNHDQRFVIFGAWDTNTDGDSALILSETWIKNNRGRRNPGYNQSREHIRLVEEEGYELKTFPMIYSSENVDEHGVGPAKIKDFIPELKTKLLTTVGNGWYASDGESGVSIPQEIDFPGQYIEGASKKISVNIYERNADARRKCLSHHGYRCAVCDFDFEEVYGKIGEKFIHVHHVVPLSKIRKEYELNPVKDLIPVCPNCHSIIHRANPALTVEQLRAHLREK